MNILLLAKKNPYPPNDGEAIAILQLAKGLVENGNTVSVLYMNTPKHNYPLSDIPQHLQSKMKFYEVWVDNKITISGAFSNLFRNKPYHVERFKSNAFNDQLIKLLSAEKFEIVQCEGLFLTSYINTIRKYSSAKIIYRSHNIESNIWKRFASSESNPLKKNYIKLQAGRLNKYELNIIDAVDAIVPISKADGGYYQKHFPDNKIKYSPTGIDPEKIVSSPQNIDPNQIYFLGALDWLPNRQGLLWFLKEIFPGILKTHPQIQLHIAGRNAPADFGKEISGDGIYYHGEINDAADFVADKMICIVPLLSGSGMKIKIPEAMAQAKLVVTTTVGAEGLPDGAGKNMLISSDAADFTNKLSNAIDHPEDTQALALAGREFVLRNLDNTILTAELSEFYKSLCP